MKKLICFLLLIPILNLFADDCITISPTKTNNHFILVVDKSGSMGGEPVKNIKSALQNFVQDMKGNDKASLILFDDVVHVTDVYSSNKPRLNNSIRNFNVGGTTALYDALGKAAVLAHEKNDQTIIVFFTDGHDNSSHLTLSDIKSVTHSQGFYVYGIALGDVNQRELANIARETNGAFMYADNSRQLTDLYDKVLSNYYNIFDKTKNQTARIIVKSHPSGRPVYVNGNLQKHNTPLIMENLRPGSYNVLVKFDRGEWECAAEIFGGYTGEIEARENDLGRDIAVISDVKSAMVFIDDNFVGYTSNHPFIARTVKTGWFSKTTKFNFDKQLIIKNIPKGNHVIKIIGLEEMENFFQPLEKRIYIDKQDLIINAEFLQNNLEVKETKKILRQEESDDPYDNIDDMFENME